MVADRTPREELPANISINDAAALIIQLEPEDLSELDRLLAVLGEIIKKDLFSTQVNEHLDVALQKLQTLPRNEPTETATILKQVGELIENAIQMSDELESSDQSQLEPDKGKTKALKNCSPEENEWVPPPSHGEKDDYMPTTPDLDLMEAFVAESNDLISSAEEALLALETNPEEMESIRQVFRAFHTIKGTAACLQLDLVSEIGHHAETLLNRVRNQEIRYEGGYADLSLRTLDMIKELVFHVQEALKGKPLTKPDGYDDILKILQDPEKEGVSGDIDEYEASPHFSRLGDILVAQGKVTREMVEKIASDEDEKPFGKRILETQSVSVTDVAHALRTQQRIDADKKPVETTVRIPTTLLDRFIDMVGELVVAHSMVAQDDSVSSGRHQGLQKKVTHTSKIVRELQHMSMSMRMTPLKATFRKMARLVRDLSRQIGKSVSFVSDGEETEIDRHMVNIINDPLVHMVRNAVDHGIESPEERIQKGKPPNGTIQLSAYHKAGRVIVEIKDDGRGFEREAIWAKAKEKGLIKGGHELADTPTSDQEIINLIFEPGFSTAKEVSNVSGRGVGMDVVKRNIEKIRGQIEVNSKPGKGVVFKMSLPLTLAIIDGMVVRVGDERYVLPTHTIVRSVQPKPSELTTALKRGEILSLQGKLIPIIRLAELFDIHNSVNSPTEGIVVIVEDEMNNAGLLIDELIGTQQIVIKTLGETMSHIPGISGSAIMPDGRVGLIIDVGGIVKIANEDNSLAERAP